MENLKETIEEAFRKLEAGEKSVPLPYIPFMEYTELFEKEFDIDLMNDYDTNGWDHGFWCTFFNEKTNKEYTLGGCWYSGGYEIYESE